MSARDEILDRVREALRPAPRPVRDIPRDYRATTQDGLDAFLERLAHYDARAIHTTTTDLDATVRNTLTERQARDVITPDGVPGSWLTTVNQLKDTPPLDNEALDGADGVVTTCALAIAQTGTIVLDGGPGMGRRALTLLPDYHLCVVRTEQIVPSVPEAVSRLDPTRPLTFISGPSATVDIEMVRVKGVHGPRTLDVILVAAP
ncbi:MAG TPA: lactate utilization protein C [Solirubrobacteraceae bacterium]|nr:lactate utilization protein C [Solirubrobacteraceae bacterium]